MSDQPQGPGWWQASDYKWYPPESVPAPTPPPPAPPVTGWGAPQPSGFAAPQPGYGTPSFTPPVPARRSRTGLIVGAALLAFLLLVGGVLFAINRAANNVKEAAEEFTEELTDNQSRVVQADGSLTVGTGTMVQPLALGTEVDLGNGWRVRVNSAVIGPIADAAVVGADPANPLAYFSTDYALVNVTVSYSGAEVGAARVPMNGLAFEMYGKTSQMFLDDRAVPPSPLPLVSELPGAGFATGNILFTAPEADADLVLHVTLVDRLSPTNAWMALS